MSGRIRFNTARQVFEAFPKAANSIKAEPDEEAPIAFLRKLIARAHRYDALTYAAYLLPRREAVWWGAQCLRAMDPSHVDNALTAAEAWVRDPDEGPRRAALTIWEAGGPRKPTTWLAKAAGQSGGNIAPDDAAYFHPAPPEMTAVGVKCAIILAIAGLPALEQPRWTVACAEAAIRFAEGGDSKVLAPARMANPAVA